VAEHVEALGAVVHGVGGDLHEGGAAGDLEGPAITEAARGEIGEGEAMSLGLEFVRDLVEEGEELVGRAVLAVGFEARAGVGSGESFGPGAHGAEDVGERVVEGAGADVEAAVELLGGEGSAGGEELSGSPLVVREEDLEGV
jgi:hypothetical protein